MTAVAELPVVLDAAHRYWQGTRELAGASAVLKAAGYCADLSGLPDRYRIRGTLVHQATELVDHYETTWEQVARLSDEVGLYAESYAKFLADHRVRWRLREQVVADLVLGTAGTADAIGDVDDIEDAVVDFKSGADDPAYAVQLAGYEHMTPRVMPIRRRRFVLLLQADGRRAILVPKADRKDYDAWHAAVAVYYWRKRNGRL